MLADNKASNFNDGLDLGDDRYQNLREAGNAYRRVAASDGMHHQTRRADMDGELDKAHAEMDAADEAAAIGADLTNPGIIRWRDVSTEL